ncbi:MAG: OmpA family protein [Ignavibacteria bacterium]|jgi:outer membrane protein OmpA-like peptidoglycan-associated protein|nr:OmpA family protein [Ignavibacteria bacterium]
MTVVKIFGILIIIVILFSIVLCIDECSQSNDGIVTPDKLEIAGPLSNCLKVVDGEYEIVTEGNWGRLSVKLEAIKVADKSLLGSDIVISASILNEKGMPVTMIDEFKSANFYSINETSGYESDAEKNAKIAKIAKIAKFDADLKQLLNNGSGQLIVELSGGCPAGEVSKASKFFVTSISGNSITSDFTGTIEKNKNIVLRNVEFQYNKAELKSKSFKELEKLVNALSKDQSLKIEISGHTSDDPGDDAYRNQVLSEERARAIYDYLIEHNIASSRLSHKGYGSTMPIADNETESGRQKNRRVEFRVK